MSVRIEGDIIHLAGRCLAQEAEDLLRALQEAPGAMVDIAAAERVHMAVLQVLLALRPAIQGRAASGSLSDGPVLRLLLTQG